MQVLTTIKRLFIAFVAVLSLAGCRTVGAGRPGGHAPLGVRAENGGPPASQGAELAGALIDPSLVPVVDPAAPKPPPTPKARSRPRLPIPDAQADALRAAALALPPDPGIRSFVAGGLAPSIGANFDGPDGNSNINFTVPPDPEVAVGPNHVVVVVNTALAIYDKVGTLLWGPTDAEAFFAAVVGCTTLFDPNILYDEAEDRFVMGWDSGGSGYCIGATETGDPLGLWRGYRFGTTFGGEFFDYPHAGVGREAIYMGGNIFNGSFVRADVWAINKAALYSDALLPLPVRKTIGGQDTPQPMNLHGFAQGTWPSSGPHYILADTSFDGSLISVWSWSDPFGANTFTFLGSVNLNVATGVTAGMPINTPQLDGGSLQTNDWRVQDAEYRNGSVWMAQTIACNPGGGTVNCVRWAEIDPAAPSIVQAGLLASDGQHRIFGDVAVNHCDDMTLGYTKSSLGMYPAAFFTGRLGSDAPGTLQAEAELKAGEIAYQAFDGAPYRWGDYTGATSDPDGVRTWYLGEYSKNTGTAFARWGTRVGSFTGGCLFADGFESGDVSAWSAAVP